MLDPRHTWTSLGIAVAIAVLAALLFESLIRIQPVPPGGDTGTWLFLSYAYAHLPYPPQAAPFTYPPASFPFLGAAVVLVGPLNGARLFAGVVIALMGLSFYYLGRSMFQLRVVPLLMEAALFLQPDFQQLYYFGAYPNMFGFIFFFLALGLGLRFLRSRNPRHLALFWGAAAVAILAHALVGLILIGGIAFLGIILLVYRRLPRELLTSRTGILSFFGALAACLAYYAGQSVLQLGGPNYLAEGSLAEATSRALFPSVLKPFYLQTISTVINGTGFTLTVDNSVQIVAGVFAAAVGVLLLVRATVPRALSFRHAVLAAWLLSAFAICLGCYALGIGADYRRVAYFIFPLTILGIGLVLDLFLAYVMTPAEVKDVLEPLGAPKLKPLTPAPFRWQRWSLAQGTFAFVVAITVVTSLVVADTYTVPKAKADARFFSSTGHDAGFVDAMNAVDRSPVPGSIFSATQSVDRWPAALTSRNIYEVRSPTGFTYSQIYLQQDEQAFLTLNYALTASNGLVTASVPGFGASYLTAAPVFGVYDAGVLHQVSQVSSSGIFTTLSGGKPTSLFPNGSFVPPEVRLGPSASDPSYSLLYNETGYVLIENVTAPAGTSHIDVTLTALATGATGLTALHASLYGATGLPEVIQSTGGSFTWVANTTAANYATSGRLLTPGVLTSVPYYPGNATLKPKSGSVTFAAPPTSSGGNRSLTVGIELSASGVSNPVASALTGITEGSAVLSQWQCRFALFWSGSTASGPNAITFFETNYAATPFTVNGTWTVLELPAVLPPV